MVLASRVVYDRSEPSRLQPAFPVIEPEWQEYPDIPWFIGGFLPFCPGYSRVFLVISVKDGPLPGAIP